MKLIFVDIDGTLTVPGENVPPDSALAAIRKTQAKGNKVFLCTGRNLDMLKPLLVYGFDGIVGSGGAYVTVGDDVIIVQAPAYRVVDKGLIFATGVYCNYLPAIDAYDTGEFSVTCIYEDVPDDKFNPARWVYFEQGPPLAAIYHYTGIREGK